MQVLRVSVSYQRGPDVLLLTTDTPTPSVSEEIARDIFLRKAMPHGEVTGVEVIDFGVHVQDAAWLASLPDVGPFRTSVGDWFNLSGYLEWLWASLKRQDLGPIESESELLVSGKV